MLLLRDLTDIYTPAGAIGSPEDVLRRAKGTKHQQSVIRDRHTYKLVVPHSVS